LAFIQDTLGVLTGTKPIPGTESDPQYIRNRSVCKDNEDDRMKAIDYMESVIRNMGYDQVEKQIFNAYEDRPTQFCNLVVTIPGPSEDLIVIGGHYDVQNSLSRCWHGTKGTEFLVTQGADDNGSGTVACIALLKRFKDQNIQFSRTVKVVLFDGEEPGSQVFGIGIGSCHFTSTIPDDTTVNIFLNIDMLGGPICDPEYGYCIAFNHINAEKLNNYVQDNLADYKIHLAGPKDKKCNLNDYSDSQHFKNMGFPVAFLSNVAGLQSLPDFYHTEMDTIDIIDWEAFKTGIDIAEILLKNEWYI